MRLFEIHLIKLVIKGIYFDMFKNHNTIVHAYGKSKSESLMEDFTGYCLKLTRFRYPIPDLTVVILHTPYVQLTFHLERCEK